MSVLTRSGSLDAAVPMRRSLSMESKALQQHLHQQSLSQQHEVAFLPVDDPPVKDSSPDNSSEDACTDNKEHPPASAASHLFTAASVLAVLLVLTLLVVSTAPLLGQDAGATDSGDAQDQASLPPAQSAYSAADLDEVAAEARVVGASGGAAGPRVRWLGDDVRTEPEPKAERWTVVLAPARRGAAATRTPPATPVPTREPNDDEEPHGVETVATALGTDVGRGGEGGYEDHVSGGEEEREHDDSRGRTFSKELADYLANDAALERERGRGEGGATRGDETRDEATS